jgi:sugar/nucleoside kinase (ribokinase family)
MKITVLGHITKDVIITEKGEKEAIGGSAIYGALTAQGLGWDVCLVSKIGNDFDLGTLNGISKGHIIRTDKTTTFRNIYKGQDRTQEILEVAEPIYPRDIPDKIFNSQIIHIGPVMNEIPYETVKYIRKNGKDCLISADLQGFVREKKGRQVRGKKIKISKLMKYVDVLKISLSDEFYYAFENFEQCQKYFKKIGKIALVTKGDQGSYVLDSNCYTIPAFPTKTVDSTGAGDMYAIAFIIRYSETKDIEDSAIFASATASFVVEDWGATRIPSREEVDLRLQQN